MCIMNTPEKKINISEMDNALETKCKLWLQAVDSFSYSVGVAPREAALDDFVHTTIHFIHLNGEDPLHRHDVIAQAVATIKSLDTKYAKNRIIDFYYWLTQRMLDDQYNNSNLPTTIDTIATKVNDGVQKTLNIEEK